MSSPSPKANLRNTITFPSFANLPSENGINSLYYAPNPQTGIYSPTRHWAFLGEIVDFTMFLRLQVTVKDRSGQELPIYMHTDDRGKGLAQQCQPGSTLVITYAEKHYFMDGSVGIRLEEGSSFHVIPHSIADLLATNDAVIEEDRKGKCASCGVKGGDLKMCSGCKVTFYCGRECQVKAWAKVHKKQCKVITAIKWFTDKDWDKFEGWWNRRLQPVRAPRPFLTAYTMNDDGELVPMD